MEDLKEVSVVWQCRSVRLHYFNIVHLLIWKPLPIDSAAPYTCKQFAAPNCGMAARTYRLFFFSLRFSQCAANLAFSALSLLLMQKDSLGEKIAHNYQRDGETALE